MGAAKILLADDHVLFTDILKMALERHFQVVGTVADGRTLVEKVPELRPDLVILDIGMPHLNGIEAARQLKASAPEVKLIFLTSYEEPEVFSQAMSAGASGYLLKRSASAELFQAISEVLAGRTFVTPTLAEGPLEAVETPEAVEACSALTPRQREVLELLVGGMSMKQVAAALHVTPRTVAFHKYRMMEELGISSTAELIQFALRHGIKAPQ